MAHPGACVKPHEARSPFLTAPLDSDDDDGGGAADGPAGSGSDGDHAMDGDDNAGPPPDIEDLSIHSFDGHTGMKERKRRRDNLTRLGGATLS